MNPLGDPEELEALAARYDLRASQLQQMTHRVDGRFRTATWVGPKADRWRARMQFRAREGARLADELRAVARELRRCAAEIRAEIAALHRIERLVRDLLTSVADTVNDLIDPLTLPAPGDPAWRAVARRLDIS